MDVTAGILMGGKSSRMGQTKATLTYRGDSFIMRLAKLCDFCPEVLVSVNESQKALSLPLKTVVDELSGFGPPEGLYQLLSASKYPYVLLIATDMQYLERDFLKKLTGTLQGSEDCLVLKSPHGLEPLCSIYSKNVLDPLKQMRTEGLHRLRFLYDQVHTRYVDAQDLGVSEEYVLRMVSNINTPPDYNRLLSE